MLKKNLSNVVSVVVRVVVGFLGISFLASQIARADIQAASFGWIQEKATGKWWYKNPDGSYPTNSWVWLDGDKNGVAECYFFDNEGWLKTNTTTPDGYTVDESGAWVKDGQVERRTEEELKNPKVAETKAEEGTSSVSTDPTVPIHIPEPKEVEEQTSSRLKDVIKGGLVIAGNKSDEESIGGFIPDSEFEKLAQYARDNGFTTQYKNPNGEWVEGKLLLLYSMARKYIPNNPNPNSAYVTGKIYNGNKYVQISLFMDEGKQYATYTVNFYDGEVIYGDRDVHTKAYSIAELREAIDYAVGNFNPK